MFWRIVALVCLRFGHVPSSSSKGRPQLLMTASCMSYIVAFDLLVAEEQRFLGLWLDLVIFFLGRSAESYGHRMSSKSLRLFSWEASASVFDGV